MKMLAFVFALGLTSLLAPPNSAFAQSPILDCKKFNGFWSGIHTYGLTDGQVTSTSQQRDVSFEINDCKFIWVSSRGNNYCEIYIENKQTLYKCSFGSRGIVRLNGNNIQYRNTFTGNFYMVSIKKQK